MGSTPGWRRCNSTIDRRALGYARFYRTAHGAEADLILSFRNGDIWGVEIKRASAPTVSKGFHLAAADVGATKRLLVAPVAMSYLMRDGIEVMNPLMAAQLLASH